MREGYKTTTPLTSKFGPFSLLGQWKYRLGFMVKYGQEIYEHQTQGHSQSYKLAWVGGVIMAMAVTLVGIMYLNLLVMLT